MKPSRIITIAICALVIAAALVFIFSAYNLGRTQERNMRLAGKHIAVVEPSIRADPRFEHVELSSFTSDNGCLIVLGYVDSDQALNDLRRMIAASKPPVFTKWAVNVIPEETKPK